MSQVDDDDKSDLDDDELEAIAATGGNQTEGAATTNNGGEATAKGEGEAKKSVRMNMPGGAGGCCWGCVAGPDILEQDHLDGRVLFETE